MQVPGDPVTTGCELTVGQPTVSLCTAGSQLIDLRCIPVCSPSGYVRRSPDRNRAVPVEGGEQGLRLPGLGSVPIRLPAPSSAARQEAAENAAADLRLGFWAAVVAEIRWAFTPPRDWLSGVGINLVLALVFLIIDPLHLHRHQDWVVVVGTYFASFILADVTTTNLLGVDHIRVGKALHDGVPFWRLLLVKNVALIVIVGLPTLVVAMAMTLWMETPARLMVTIPTVAVPILSWIGIGNVMSVLLPVATEPLISRWRQRRQLRLTIAWVAALALPYALFYVADPIDGLPHKFLWREVPAAIGPILGHHSRSVIHIGIALAVWIAGIAVAQWVVSRRGLRTVTARRL